MRTDIVELELRAEIMEAEIAADKKTLLNVVEIHPNLSALYQRKVTALKAAMDLGPSARAEAVNAIRGIVTEVRVKPVGEKRGQVALEPHGSIPAILAFASAKEGSNQDLAVLMVAAEGFEPPTKGL